MGSMASMPFKGFNGFNEAQRPSRGSKASKVRLADLEVDREILRPSICRKRFKGETRTGVLQNCNKNYKG
tara:strand:- start:1217 stop:1426 length:210 start_codon:yes stop_codon:yes gene_type:complete